MTIAAALILFAIGAILKFAVTAQIGGINIGVVGIILMIVGAVGFVIGLLLMFTRRRTDVVSHVMDGRGEQRTRTSYITPTDPDDPRL